MNQTKFFITTIAIALLLSFTVTVVPLWADSKEEIKQEKADLRKMAKETLTRLYKVQPAAKKAVSKSAGYAVVSPIIDIRIMGMLPPEWKSHQKIHFKI